MKLTIDTKEDSKEEIKKAISMLSALVGEGTIYTNTGVRKEHNANIFDSDSSSLGETSPEPSPQQPAQNAFANMFGAVSSASQPSAETPEEKTTEDKDKDDSPQIIIEY